MFLAWKEMKKNKLRFTLITGVLMLVAFLVFFLSGLATGLQHLNREAVDKWDADAIVLTEESDKSLGLSSMTVQDHEGIDADETAVLGQFSAIANNEDEKANISVFGINEDEFLMPEVTDGEKFTKENEVIAGDKLKEDGFAIGDTLSLSGTEAELTIVGFTDNARFHGSPVLYTDLDTFHRVKFGELAEQNSDRINGVVIRTDNVDAIETPEEIEVIGIDTFIENLPGYTEQNLTLNLMIYFLIVISAIIVAIFLYVLTVQKMSMFGVLKAQGISSRYLANSVIAQTFLISFIGVVIGFGLTLLTGAFLPSAVPVSFDMVTMMIYGLIFVVVAIMGAVFSVRTIVKIDPLQAIGG